MEKNNKNNSLPSDLDNLRLKDHLNASFDMDNIKVSEDLIARTLKAIRESEPQEEQQKEENKIRHFPVRRLVSAAAVALVLLAGIGVLQNGLISNKNDTQLNMESGAAESAEPGELAIYNTAADDSAGLNGETGYGLASDSAVTEAEAPSAEESVNEYAADTKGTSKVGGAGTDSVLSGTKFSGLYPAVSDRTSTFTLLKNDGTKESAASAPDKVRQFISLLDEYPLTASVDQKMDNEGNRGENWSYKAEIMTAEKQTYTIYLGEEIQVLQGEESTESTSSTYLTENMDTLLKQVDDFFISLQ